MKPNRELSARRAAQQEAALCNALVTMQDADEMRALLGDLCTPAELQALVDRWQVVRLLDEGLPYRRINELTGVSVTTIGRVARFLADGFGGYRRALDRTRNP
jgi:TrpR-related protein YerC/YecD